MEKYRQKQRFSSMIAAVHASCNKKETDVFQHFHLQKQRFFSRIREKLVKYDVMFLLFTQLLSTMGFARNMGFDQNREILLARVPPFSTGSRKIRGNNLAHNPEIHKKKNRSEQQKKENPNEQLWSEESKKQFSTIKLTKTKKKKPPHLPKK